MPAEGLLLLCRVEVDVFYVVDSISFQTFFFVQAFKIVVDS